MKVPREGFRPRDPIHVDAPAVRRSENLADELAHGGSYPVHVGCRDQVDVAVGQDLAVDRTARQGQEHRRSTDLIKVMDRTCHPG